MVTTKDKHTIYREGCFYNTIYSYNSSKRSKDFSIYKSDNNMIPSYITSCSSNNSYK